MGMQGGALLVKQPCCPLTCIDYTAKRDMLLYRIAYLTHMQILNYMHPSIKQTSDLKKITQKTGMKFLSL